MRFQAGHPLRWVIGLVLAVALTTGGWLVTRSDDYVATRPTQRPAVADPAGAELALRRWAADLGRGAKPASGDAALATSLRNAAAAGVTGVTAHYVDELGAVSAEGRWTGAVDLTWRLEGYDAAPAHAEIAVGFARTGREVRITGFGGADRRLPLWLAGPLQVRRSADLLVLSTADAATADRYDRLARAALPVVERVLRDWHGPLVLEAPETTAQLGAALGAAAGDYAAVAAVTATVDGSQDADAPVHVFVNPEVMRGLERRGAEIVLAHEATHLATGAATNVRLPLWLAEGFADYVALRDVRLPITTTAGQIIASVRQDGLPDHLPGKAEFDATSGSFGAEYEAAWLACRVLADRAGEAALVALYRDVAAGADLDTALRRGFGFGLAGLTDAWRNRLRAVSAQ